MQGTAIKLSPPPPMAFGRTHVLQRDDKFCWSIFLRETEIKTNVLLFDIGQVSNKLDGHQLYFRGNGNAQLVNELRSWGDRNYKMHQNRLT